jgi:predicted nuclease with TOPRIM domain
MSNQIDLLQSLDLEKIRASSRKAAWGSLVGGVIVVSAIVFSVIRIGMLDREVATRTEQITDLQEQIEPLKSTQKELETQVSKKKTELDRLQAQLTTAKSDLETAEEKKRIALDKEKEALAKEQDALARKNDSVKQLDVARANKSAFEELVSANFSRLNDMGAMKDPVELLRVGVVPRASAEPLLEDSGDASPNIAIQSEGAGRAGA